MRLRATIAVCLSLFLSLFLLAGMAPAQQISGSISGVVQDAQGAVVPGAKVTLVNQTQGATERELNTSPEGRFMFTPLLPATYSVTVEAAGFKKYTKTDMALPAGEQLGLPPIALEVGAATESITVAADAVTLETVSSARSGVVTQNQVADLAMNGRNFGAVMRTIPGVQNDTTGANGQIMGGQRTDQYSFTVDGTTMEDSGCGCFAFSFTVDAIAEITVATNGLAAEYGHSAGPQVTVVTKSGSKDFHGTGYWFHRNEGLDANTWDRNYNNLPRSLYRYLTAGWNFSGPFYIPGHLNRSKDKIFFFAQQEWNHSLSAPSPEELTMPTAAQRVGDFSAIKNASGASVTITDPNNNHAPFPGNQIPQARWNSYGVGILNYLPLPNYPGSNQYNWISQVPSVNPSLQQVYKVDYNITDKWRVSFRNYHFYNTQHNPYGGNASANLLDETTLVSPTGAWGVNFNVTTIIKPTLTNEFIYGNTRNYLPYSAPTGSSPYLRANSTAMAIPLLFPNADPSKMVPNLAFGGIPQGTGTQSIGNSSAGYTQFYGLPYVNVNPTANYTDNVTWVHGAHVFKAGAFYEQATKTQSPYADVNGSLTFDQDSANPGDTNWAYSNALLGNYRNFTQMSNYEIPHYRYNNYEGYIQDTWKARSNLTISYGLRVAIIAPLYETGNLVSSFNPATFDPKTAPVLYQPTLVNGARMALNPLTGQTQPSTFIGLIAGGNINDGMNQQGVNGYPQGLIKGRGPQWGPRIGVAWLPGGASGKTVIRFGGGTFFERIQGNMMFYQITNPPVLRESQLWYGNINTIASAQQVNSPVYANGISEEGKIPTVYNFNFGIQRQLPMNILMDVGYVGSLSRHETELVPFNDVPLGSAWQPQNQDPTKCPNMATCNLNGDNALPVVLYRPYQGYNGPAGSSQGTLYRFGGTANYNSLQVAVNRRMSHTFQMGVAYTWSKALGIQSSTTTDAVLYQNLRQGMYGPLTFDKEQMLSVNYLYNLPAFARKGSFLDNAIGRGALNGWQYTGLTAITSGAPIQTTGSNSTSASYSVTTTGGSSLSGAALNREITGSEDIPPRYVFTCSPFSGGGAGSMNAFVNSSCFAPAKVGSQGMDSGWDRLRGPGANNWDMSIYKKFQYMKDESKYIQLRVEAYNAPNHVEWSGWNSTAQFNAAGQVANLPSNLGGTGGRFGFGALNATRSNSQRIIQLAVKLYF